MATNSVANQPSAKSTNNTASAVKVATPEIILFDDGTMPIETMTDLIFENIGGHELINIARNDLMNGQDVIYQPIKNLTHLNFLYNPLNILKLQGTSSTYFKNFAIRFESKVPNIGTGPKGEIVYIDPDTGNLVINVINMLKDEQVEVQILSSGDVLDDTIYGVIS